MRESNVSQRVRVALVRLEATSHGRPVTMEQLLRELPGESEVEIQTALQGLADARLAHVKGEGWLTRPPPIGADATSARANASRLHSR